MQLTRSARVVAAALLVASVGGSLSPTASSRTEAAAPTYQTGQGVDPPFNPPTAPGEPTSPVSTAATEAEEPVDMAPGETGTLQQLPTQFTEDEDDDEDDDE